MIAKFSFRGCKCELVQDFGSIWGRDHENEESRILTRFETLLDQWASTGDVERLNAALDHLASRNRSSQIWTVFLLAGAKYPTTLGRELEPVLTESFFLTHPDYSYGGTALLATMHRTGTGKQRKRLEKLILDLPQTAHLSQDEPRDPVPSRIEHARDRLLGVLDEVNIVSSRVRLLRNERLQQGEFPANAAPEGIHVTSHGVSNEEMLERQGISLKDAENLELFQLCESLKPFKELGEGKIKLAEIEQHWPLIEQCEHAVRRRQKTNSKMARELWGNLVSACEGTLRYANWPASCGRWKVIRRILLRASSDPVPKPAENEDAKRDRWPAYGWPSPRIHAAEGLPILVQRIGNADKTVAAALRRLSRDKSHPVRFCMARRLASLKIAAPVLMWQLIDRYIRSEQKFSVLEAVVETLGKMAGQSVNQIMLCLTRITERAMQQAPIDNHIFETLANTHLFHFLRTGDLGCEGFINRLIDECDSQRASNALERQLHECRTGGWLTAGDALTIVDFEETVRKRTWKFLGSLLRTAQAKCQHYRNLWKKLHESGQPDLNILQPVQEGMNRTSHLVDAIASQLYFTSGAFAEKQNKDDDRLTDPQKRRFWEEAKNLFDALALEIHPHTAHQLVETLFHLLPCEPSQVFMTAAKTIASSSTAGYQHDSIAVGDVVKIIQRSLADHREMFQGQDKENTECLTALLKVLDLFVEAGWPEARQLTHRLEEIYR